MCKEYKVYKVYKLHRVYKMYEVFQVYQEYKVSLPPHPQSTPILPQWGSSVLPTEQILSSIAFIQYSQHLTLTDNLNRQSQQLITPDDLNI